MATAAQTSERNKKIAAVVLGVVALIALYFAFGRSLFGGSAKTNVSVTATPRPTATPAGGGNSQMPTMDEQTFVWETTPVDYRPGQAYAPDPGRNIFAFYEPPPPTPYVPTPIPPPVYRPPSPTPTPDFAMTFLNPQTVFRGSQGFRLEVNGDRFTPLSRIYFNQVEMPTTYINPQRLVTDIPANLVAQDGPRQIIVQTPDGRSYSNPMMLMVQPPPTPNVQYIGMIGRKRFNNDTAYFTETGKPNPFGARLNDIVSSRFRLVDISPTEVIFEDVNLGFRHRVPISKAVPVTGPMPPAGPNPGGMAPFDPATMVQPGGARRLPGIPAGVQQVPSDQKPTDQKPDQKQDVDDEDGTKP